MKNGIWNAIGAYLLWGILPIYWKLLEHVPPMQIISHRVIWSLIFLAIVISLKKEWKYWKEQAFRRRVLPIYILTGLLLGLNWFIYVWGVNTNRIVETSLGYFINPLLSVLYGVIFLRERLRSMQWVTISMVGIAVVYLTIIYGSLPWIALTLAGTFSLYGLLKKIAPLGSLYGLTVETGVLFLPSLFLIFGAEFQGGGAMGHTGFESDLLLIGTGIVTTLPLLLFTNAARSIPLWMMGLLQYIAPTMQFLIGVLVYGEPFALERAIGFIIIWAALIIFWLEGFFWHRQTKLTLEGLP